MIVSTIRHDIMFNALPLSLKRACMYNSICMIIKRVFINLVYVGYHQSIMGKVID